MMMKTTTLVLATSLAVAAATALAHGSPESMRRHHQFMQSGVPAPYGGKTSPVPSGAETVTRGRALYDDNCALCHGPAGNGDGPAAKDLDVPPAELAHILAMPPMKDDFLLWAIAEGGQPFGSPMPAFKDVLERDDIWRVIAFMRAGFPR